MDGRFNVARDDIKASANAALRHRMIPNFEGLAERVDPDTLVAEAVATAEAV